MNDSIKRIYDIILFDSQESNIDIIELLNDMVYNMELAGSLDMTLEELATITNSIESNMIYDNLENGHTITYDKPLKNGSLKNLTDIVLAIDSKSVKLNRLNITWYCTKEYFMQLLNVSVYK